MVALSNAKSQVLEDARDAIVPAAQQAIAEAGRRGRKAAAKVGLTEEEKETHRLRTLVVLLLVAGIAVAVYKKVAGGRGDAWTEVDTAPVEAETKPVEEAAEPEK